MYTYTSVQLEHKTFGELKAIAREFDIVPSGDRRCRQNWIDALVGVNPPLLQLLEVSPAASVEQVQQLIVPAAENSPGVEVEQATEPIAPLVENSPGVKTDPVEQPIIETVETLFPSSVEPVSELSLEAKFGRIVYPRLTQGAIAPAAENSPGVEVDRVPKPFIEMVESPPGVEIDSLSEPVTESNRNNFSGFESVTESNRNNFSGFEPVTESNRNNFSGVEVDRVQKAVEILPGVESDRHPILRGVIFSDRFLARYSPPQAQIIHFQSDADGQLSLLDFEVESVDEPPDPDDFESLDAFREEFARWDSEHNEVSPSDNEPLQILLDSFCLWAPCPHTWYEPTAGSSVIEFLPAVESSDTSNFFILTFGQSGDRSNRSDEPPDTGIFARLPKSKPPSFSPTAATQARVKRIPNSAQTQSKRIPNAYQTHTCCIATGSSTQPARSPPGGDA